MGRVGLLSLLRLDWSTTSKEPPGEERETRKDRALLPFVARHGSEKEGWKRPKRYRGTIGKSLYLGDPLSLSGAKIPILLVLAH